MQGWSEWLNRRREGRGRGANSWCLTLRGSLNGERGQWGGAGSLMCNSPCRCSHPPTPHFFSHTRKTSLYVVGVC